MVTPWVHATRPSGLAASVVCLHPPHVNVLPTGLRGVRQAGWLQLQSQRTISQRPGVCLFACACIIMHVMSRRRTDGRTDGRRAASALACPLAWPMARVGGRTVWPAPPSSAASSFLAGFCRSSCMWWESDRALDPYPTAHATPPAAS